MLIVDYFSKSFFFFSGIPSECQTVWSNSGLTFCPTWSGSKLFDALTLNYVNLKSKLSKPKKENKKSKLCNRIKRALGPWVAHSRMTDQWSGTICEILVECIMRNNAVNFFLNLGQWFRRCRLKDFLSRALAVLLFGAAEPFMQFWKMASWGIFMWSYMEFGPVVKKDMSIKDITYLELWPPLCSADPNHLCNFGRRYHEEKFCGIILNLDQWFKRNKGISYLDIWQPFCST